jgi:hypothetical protein
MESRYWHELKEITLANDQMKGVFAKAIDVDWIQDTLSWTKW